MIEMHWSIVAFLFIVTLYSLRQAAKGEDRCLRTMWAVGSYTIQTLEAYLEVANRQEEEPEQTKPNPLKVMGFGAAVSEEEDEPEED